MSADIRIPVRHENISHAFVVTDGDEDINQMHKVACSKCGLAGLRYKNAPNVMVEQDKPCTRVRGMGLKMLNI